MGVMRCDRFECENVMCHRYSSKFGYICSDCFEELLTRNRCYGDESIGLFMDSSPKPYNSTDLDVYQLYLNTIFHEN